ncbi:MAG: DivIVA domain-containing protein [Thermoleophilia bacterium]
MKLTPLDIRHKEFKRGMRGYADSEVDEFLDEVADEFERLFKENIDLGERVEALDEKIAHYHMIEDTLQKTLISAQQSADELKANATKEGELILRDAELKARQMVNESYADKQRVEKELAALKNAEDEFRFRFRSTLEGYLGQLGDLDRNAQQRVSEFQRQADALKEAIAREDTVAPRQAQAAPSVASSAEGRDEREAALNRGERQPAAEPIPATSAAEPVPTTSATPPEFTMPPEPAAEQPTAPDAPAPTEEVGASMATEPAAVQSAPTDAPTAESLSPFSPPVSDRRLPVEWRVTSPEDDEPANQVAAFDHLALVDGDAADEAAAPPERVRFTLDDVPADGDISVDDFKW